MNTILIGLLMLARPDGTMRANIVDPAQPTVKVVVRDDVFLGAINLGNCWYGVMSTTEVLLDGSPADYFDVPDEGTELLYYTINTRRRVVARLEYVTKRDL